MKNNKKFKQAFTLAESIICLALIGVVAAMSLPILITNISKKETPSQLKKAYSGFFQLIEASETTNGAIQTWDIKLDADKFFGKYLKTHANYTNTGTSEELFGVEYKYLNEEKCKPNEYSWCAKDAFAVQMSDGTGLLISDSANGGQRQIAIDINGRKSPNTIGTDVFVFSVVRNRLKFIPYGLTYKKSSLTKQIEINNDASVRKQILKSCDMESDGTKCAALIMLDGWKLSKDYPW